MGDFKREKPRFGSSFSARNPGKMGGGFGGGRNFDRRGRKEDHLEFHEVLCDKCGKECKVPFRPTRGKPVYCSDCFRRNEGSDRDGDRSNDRTERSSSSSDELAKINKKLDKIMEALDIED